MSGWIYLPICESDTIKRTGTLSISEMVRIDCSGCADNSEVFHNAFVTNHAIDIDNVAEIVEAGRCR